MTARALKCARAHKAQGKPVVGIMCEYTPRELILAAGALPVCLCGGSAETIAAAETCLPSNLCPLIKSTYGYHLTGSNPFLELADLLVAETTCDGKKKMYELLARSRPMHVLELPQKADEAHAFGHWLAEIQKLKQVLETRFEVKLTDEKLQDAIAKMNRERSLRRELAGLMRRPAPPLSGRQLLALKSVIACIPEDLAQYQKTLAILSQRQPDAGMAQRVRVLFTGVPTVQGAERVVELIEQNGGLIVCSENCTGLKPLLEDVSTTGDPLRAIAEKYFHLPCSVMTPNRRRFETLKTLAGEYQAQCIIELVWQACLTYDVESHAVKELAHQLNLPYLRIETDYSPSDSARIAVRVQALFEMVRAAAR